VLLNRIKNQIQIDEIIQERTQKLITLNKGIVITAADIVERRDRFTSGHVERVAGYVKRLLDIMAASEIYSEDLASWSQELFILASYLHDVGKLYTPTAILNKPDTLTEDEFEVIKMHTTESEKVIDQMINYAGNTELLWLTKQIAVYHHERWDGTGYPFKLKETDIPLPSRILAVVDVYDALTSERPYKKPYTHEAAIRIIENNTGMYFDPAIAAVFCENNALFEALD
jgi:putative two-component system response regulator